MAASAMGDAFSSAAGKTLDALYSRVSRLNGKFFSDGWGDLDLVRIDAAREAARLVSSRAAGATVAAAARGEAMASDGSFRPDWRRVERVAGQYRVYECVFESPAADASLPALRGPLLPRESRFARARLILPDGPVGGGGGPSFSSSSSEEQTPAADGGGGIVLHLPATGDHDWSRRMRLAVPMASAPNSSHQGPRLGAILLEGPFYGARRPEGQRGAKVRSVADLFVLGWATIAEALLLAGWARGESERQGVCGLSMGGVHAAMSASLSPHPLACAPLLAPRSAVAPYVDGALAPSVAVEALVGVSGFGPSFFGVEPMRVAAELAAAASSASSFKAANAAACAADAAAEAAEAAALPSAGGPLGGSRCLRSVAAAVREMSQGGLRVGAAAATTATAADAGDDAGDAGDLLLGMPRAARALAALDALERELHRMEAEAAMAVVMGGRSGGVVGFGERQEEDEDGGAAPSAPPPTAAAAAAAAAAATAAAAAATAVSSAARALRASASARLSFFRVQEEEQAQQKQQQEEAKARRWPPPPLHQHRHTTLAWGALRAALEAYTDTTRYPLPQRPDAAVIVAARDDAYAPPADVRALHTHWKGSEMRVVPGGHVTAFLTQQPAFRAAIADSVARL